MFSLILIRHAESGFNKRETKNLDSPLTKRGVRQATECGQFLARTFGSLEDWTGYVSPFHRTLQTAKIIHRQVASNFVVNWDFREWANKLNGYHSKKTINILNRNRHYPDFFSGEEPQYFNQHYEGCDAFLNRMITLKNDLVNQGGKKIIISHAMIIYTLINLLNGIEKIPIWDKKILNTSVTWFENGECKYLAKFVNSGKDPRERDIPMS